MGGTPEEVMTVSVASAVLRSKAARYASMRLSKW